jgi:hypothetical protein
MLENHRSISVCGAADAGPRNLMAMPTCLTRINQVEASMLSLHDILDIFCLVFVMDEK